MCIWYYFPFKRCAIIICNYVFISIFFREGSQWYSLKFKWLNWVKQQRMCIECPDPWKMYVFNWKQSMRVCLGLTQDKTAQIVEGIFQIFNLKIPSIKVSLRSLIINLESKKSIFILFTVSNYQNYWYRYFNSYGSIVLYLNIN